MDLQSFDKLLTPEGQVVLQAAEALVPREADFLTHYQRLSKDYDNKLAQVALETAILRREAVSKFPPAIASRMYLTREALEQATSYEISTYRAERYHHQLEPKHIIDLGCSIGSDTLAMAGVTATTGIDRDLLRLRIAQANLKVFSEVPRHPLAGVVEFIQADLTDPLPMLAQDSTGLFFDPARRVSHRRVFSVDDYQPVLQIIRDWLPDFPSLGVKLSPGVELAELAEYQAEIEFISLHGELKECVLWFGALGMTQRRATLLPGGFQMILNGENSFGLPSRLSSPQTYLYEPDPAVIRAGLVRQMAEHIDAAQLDPDIAYLTSHTMTATPFGRIWSIEDWFPFQLKRLRAYLRGHDIGKVTVKKRGSPLQPEALIQSLHLKGKGERVVVLTHLNGEPIVLICLPVTQPLDATIQQLKVS
jgi:hypothetical protein